MLESAITKIALLIYFSGKFPIITFEEFIEIALDANRVVGIYPEMKNPVFINEHVSMPQALVPNDVSEPFRVWTM